MKKQKTALSQLIEKFEEEFRFCQEQVERNIEAREYIIAHNHSVRQEQTYMLLKVATELLEAEKQMIKDAYDKGAIEQFNYLSDTTGDFKTSDIYFTETFENPK